MPHLDLFCLGSLELRFDVKDAPVRIGRSTMADLCLNDPKVSRDQAELQCREGRFLLVNHSRFGTLLNQQLVHASAPMSFGDRLYFGEKFAITLMADAEADAPSTVGPGQEEATPPLALLLVDDDHVVRATFPFLAQAAGHRVTTVPGGPQALDLLAGGAAFDLIILSQAMPGVSGTETLARLRAGGDATPVLLATNYLDEATDALLLRDPCALGVSKPFTMKEVNLRIRAVLALQARRRPSQASAADPGC